MSVLLDIHKQQRLFNFAIGLAIFTIGYNIGEGIVATYAGYSDESLALFGFGLDSFIEVISGFGIAHMVFRIQNNPLSNRNNFERTALRITGVAFYGLVIILLLTSAYNIWSKHRPETTFWGIIIALISIFVMWLLVVAKNNVGTQLKSDAILADAECTMVCIYMSVILLISSMVYELIGFPYIDSLGTISIAYLSYKEGKECFDKAKSNKHCCSCK